MKVSFQNLLISSILYILIILSLSLYWFRFAGFAVSLATLFVFYRIVRTKFRRNEVQFIVLICVHALVALMLQISNVNFIEYIKTFSLLILAILAFIGIKYAASNSIINLKSLSMVYKILISLTVIFASAQAFEFMFYRSENLFFILDDYSISTAEDAGRFQAVNLLSYYRPVSFYHEPSYFGSVVLMLLIGARSLKIAYFWQITALLGVALSMSVTVYFFCLLFLLVELTVKVSRLVFGMIVTSCFVILINLTEITNVFRITEIFTAGTSGHERLVMPLVNIWNDVNVNWAYFGVPLGQFSIQPNNSLYVLIGYYSFLSPLAFFGIYSVIKSWRLGVKDRLNYIIFFCLMLLVNGAIISPESQMMLYFLALTLIKVKLAGNHSIILEGRGI